MSSAFLLCNSKFDKEAVVPAKKWNDHFTPHHYILAMLYLNTVHIRRMD